MARRIILFFIKKIYNVTTGSLLAERVLNSEGDDKKEEKKTRLEENMSKGKKAEKDVTKELEEEFPDDNVLPQVTGKFKDGSKTVFDDVMVSKKTGKVTGTNETKTGNAKLTKQQRIFTILICIFLVGRYHLQIL